MVKDYGELNESISMPSQVTLHHIQLIVGFCQCIHKYYICCTHIYTLIHVQEHDS